MEYLLLLAFFVLWWALRNRDSEERERQFRAVHDRLYSVERRLMESDAARQRAEAVLRAMESPRPIIKTPSEAESTPRWTGRSRRRGPPFRRHIPSAFRCRHQLRRLWRMPLSSDPAPVTKIRRL